MRVQAKMDVAKDFPKKENWHLPSGLAEFILGRHIAEVMPLPNHDVVVLYSMDMKLAALCDGEYLDACFDEVTDGNS